MCGIIGLLGTGAAHSESFDAWRDRLHHRGPDDAGTWVSSCGRAMLGHRRLSILDLSAAGHQPMVSACGRYVIVFNGEVYNFVELRSELEASGYVFNGSGDTEVVLAAFVRWGEACLSRFNGMFAFAVFDRGDASTPATLFLARDRAGKKPLYIARQGDSLAFASELKAIPESMRGAVSPDALNHYLALGYVPGALCIVKGVEKLPPGHAARYRLDSGAFSAWRWWQLPRLDADEDVPVEQLVDEAEALLHDAVRLRLRSDVPVGVLLSGGLDSSLVVASAAHASSSPIKTFTIGFPGSRLDETGYAEIVARHFGTDHHVLPLPEPSLAVLDELAPLIDEPIADSSLLPAYLVSKLTVGHVKVALGGDGGDELFGGYGDYTTAMADAARFGWVPPAAFRAGAGLAGLLPPGVRGRNRLSALRGGPFQSLVWGTPYFDAAARRRLLSNDLLDALGDRLMAPELFRLGLFQTGQDPVDAMTRTHFGSILPDDFLVKVDRASMAVSLELRCPLLDMRLIEFCFSRVPSRWKVQGREGRRLQKLLGERLLPRQLDIERKQGFSIPLNEWLRGGDAPRTRHLASDLPRWFKPGEIDALRAGHASGRANGGRLFALMMLDLACRNLGQTRN